MGRQELGVSLFSRKVLIQAKCKGLVPDWLRFVKGVVDSEDVPLNLSREHLQDSALIKRLSGVLTRRILKFLEKEVCCLLAFSHYSLSPNATNLNTRSSFLSLATSLKKEY